MSANDQRLALPGYCIVCVMARCREDGSRGGVGLFATDHIYEL